MNKISNKKFFVIVSIVFAVVTLLCICILNKEKLSKHYDSFRARHHNYEVYGGMTDKLKDSDLFDDMQSGKSFCFLGDSITSGTVAYGIHWYQPLLKYIKGNVSYLSYPGWEVTSLIDHRDIIIKADVYVIAIGINDAIIAGMSDASPKDFIDGCSYLANRIKNINPDATIYFIAPWTYIGFEDKVMKSGDNCRKALEEWCSQTDYRYINPDPVIQDAFAKEGAAKFMYNLFHPKAPEGIELFSYAVLKADHDNRQAKR